MATNDAIVLKANFENWKARADGLDPEIDPWLYYCLEQHLKSYAIDDEDLEAGITEGGGDGYYFLANNRQVVDAETGLDPKLVSSIHLLFFQVKHSGGMKPTEIEKWIQTVDDFFDLSKEPNSFGDRYNARIKSAMRIWRDQYLKLSGQFPAVLVDFYYITGDDATPDSYASDACDRVKRRVEKALKSTCRVHCVGAKQLPRSDQLKDELLLSILRNVTKFYRKLSKDSDTDSVARGPMLLKKLNAQWDRKAKSAKKAA